MDRSLKDLVSSLASNLLSTSARFEPYVPNSKQNLYYSLNLLSGLGELARVSIESEYSVVPIEPTQSPASALAQTLTPFTPQDLTQTSLSADLPPSPAPPSAPAQSKPTLSSKERSKAMDQSLLQALQTLRESKQFQRKTMGVFTPILRGNS
ncbi:MAG: hypothetical protein ABIQ95_04065 [Bdellovibrionia bacterium]